MADLTFATPAGQTIDRELLIAYLDTGTTDSPVLSAIGKRVEDSSEEYDWSQESKKDIMGNTFTTMKKPTVTQSFDPIPLDAGDPAAVKLWNLGIKDQDVQALANQKMVIAHLYATSGEAKFAESYDSCAIAITSIGGEGGGTINIATDITYGGARTLGTVKKGPNGAMTFTADAEA